MINLYVSLLICAMSFLSLEKDGWKKTIGLVVLIVTLGLNILDALGVV